MKDEFPDLIYCSISGFGQTGPKSHRAAYDFMIQAMGGIMSVTGEADGSPMKVGVGIADVMCGMYAAISILSAIRNRDHAGKSDRRRKRATHRLGVARFASGVAHQFRIKLFNFP